MRRTYLIGFGVKHWDGGDPTRIVQIDAASAQSALRIASQLHPHQLRKYREHFVWADEFDERFERWQHER